VADARALPAPVPVTSVDAAVEPAGTPRQVSGVPRRSPDERPGTIVVRVSYDDFADRNPPSQIVVTLVAYAADDTVRAMTDVTDANGKAAFEGLDSTGATAYYARVLLPRNGTVDRLSSSPIVLHREAGVRVVLSGHARGTTTAAVDDLTDDQRDLPQPGQLRVQLTGAAAPGAEVSLFDAATHGIVVRGTATSSTPAQVDLAVVPKPNQVFYAETTVSNTTYRSAPLQLVSDRGTVLSIAAFPRIMISYRFIAELDDQFLGVSARFQISNSSWTPWVAGPGGLELPLPAGFAGALVASADEDAVAVATNGFRIDAPIPPMGQAFTGGFSLPAPNGEVSWKLDLPHGAYESSLHIAQPPGMTVELDLPAGVTAETVESNGKQYAAIPNITIMPKRSMQLKLAVRPLSGAAAARTRALARACGPLNPAQSSLIGKPMPALDATQLDGTRFQLAALDGKLILINFTASWNSSSAPELLSFAALQRALPEVAIVVVSSDPETTRGAVIKTVGASPPYHVVFDPPVGTDNLGPITTAWGVPALPESFLIDRDGVVRYYVQNTRDWGSAEVLDCLRSLDHE